MCHAYSYILRMRKDQSLTSGLLSSVCYSGGPAETWAHLRGHGAVGAQVSRVAVTKYSFTFPSPGASDEMAKERERKR